MKLLHIINIILILFFAIGCDKEQVEVDPFLRVPELVATHRIAYGEQTLSPVRLQFFQDTLFVSYSKMPLIDVYNNKMEHVGAIHLNKPSLVYPTSFTISDSAIYVIDHAKHLIVIYDRNGVYQTSFGTLPDQITQLSPFSLVYYGGVLYVGDISLKKIMAVSMVDVGNLTERGELILYIPSDSNQTIGFPSAMFISEDGRMIVGDVSGGKISAYSCDGQFMYPFDTISTTQKFSPQAIDMDNIIDPSMQDTSIFDPSGIQYHGRIHVVDGNNASIHMFNTLGHYISSYKVDSAFVRPSGIAIDRRNKQIFVADPAAKSILIFNY